MFPFRHIDYNYAEYYLMAHGDVKVSSFYYMKKPLRLWRGFLLLFEREFITLVSCLCKRSERRRSPRVSQSSCRWFRAALV